MSNEKVYIIPLNYKHKGKVRIFGGYTEWSSLILAALFMVLTFIIIFKWLAFINLNIKLFAFVILQIVSVFIVMGIEEETTYDWVKYYIKWRLNRNVYLYEGKGEKNVPKEAKGARENSG